MSEREPITAELRDAMSRYSTFGGDSVVSMEEEKFNRLCDAIDAVHAGLERENAELRERVAVLDESADSMRETDAWKLGYDEGFASADDWMADNEDAMEEHGWIRLPMDADGVPFHVGELVDEMLPFGGYAAPAPIDTMELSRGASGYGWMVKLDAKNRASISPSLLRHHRAPTVEDVLREMADRCYADKDEPRDRDAIVAEYAAKLRLAGDAE